MSGDNGLLDGLWSLTLVSLRLKVTIKQSHHLIFSVLTHGIINRGCHQSLTAEAAAVAGTTSAYTIVPCARHGVISTGTVISMPPLPAHWNMTQIRGVSCTRIGAQGNHE